MNDGDVAPFGVDPLTHFHCNTFFSESQATRFPTHNVQVGLLLFLFLHCHEWDFFFREKQDCFGGRCHGTVTIGFRKVGTITGVSLGPYLG